MRRNEAPETLMDRVVKDRDWTAGVLLLNAPTYEDKRRLTTDVFLEACRRFDDESAATWFERIIQVIRDEEFVKLHEGAQHPDDLARFARTVTILAADAAVKLYETLPGFEPGIGREWVDQDETRPIPIQKPTLLKTRKAMLLRIAGGWSQEENHVSADAYFEFLLKAEQSRFPEERDLVVQVLRDAIDGNVPILRLTETLRRHEQHGELLAHAWVKSASRQAGYQESKPGAIIGAVGGLFKASPAAVRHLADISERLLVIDRTLRAIPGLDSRSEIEFRSLDSVVIRFTQKIEWRRDENSFHQSYERLRDGIREAKKGWPVHVRVRLEGKLMEPYQEGVVRTERSDDL